VRGKPIQCVIEMAPSEFAAMDRRTSADGGRSMLHRDTKLG
jgi:hypothetical protein